MNILIVDDSKSLHAHLNISLEGQLANLTHVFNGQDALLELCRLDKRYDIILLDWEMPILNGPSTLARIRELGFDVPVLMMTTKNQPKDIAEMLDLGANEYMLKPFTQDILFSKIESTTGLELRHAA